MMIVKCTQCKKKYEKFDIGSYNYPYLCKDCRKKSKSRISLIALMVVFCFIFLPSMSATIQTLGNYKQNDCVNLKQICSNCTYVNITSVLYPNSTQALGQVAMTKSTTDYNYTYCLTDSIGQYIVNGRGDLNGADTVWSYDFIISKTGTEFTVGHAILYVIGITIMVIMFLFFLYGSFMIKWKHGYNDEGRIVSVNHLKYLKIVCIVFSYVMLMYIFGFAKAITENLLSYNTINVVFEWAYWILLSLLYPLIVLSFVIMLLVFVDNYVLTKKSKRRYYR